MLLYQGRSPVHAAARSGSTEILELLIAHPSAGVLTTAIDIEGCTPLHEAAIGGHQECVKVRARI